MHVHKLQVPSSVTISVQTCQFCFALLAYIDRQPALLTLCVGQCGTFGQCAKDS